MNLNQKIEKALTPVVGKRVWPVACPLTEDPDLWVVYSPTRDVPPLYGDNKYSEWMQYVEVHFCARGIYDYISAKNAIRKALSDADFVVYEIEYSYEYGTTYRQVKATHIVFKCCIPEDPE